MNAEDRAKFPLTPFPEVTPDDLDGWSLVTSGAGQWYAVGPGVVDADETSRPSITGLGRYAFPRAYRYIEQLTPKPNRRGEIDWEVLRFVVPIGLLVGQLGVVMNVTERTPLADLEEDDRKRFVALINGAEALRRNARAASTGLDFSAAGGASFVHPGDGQRGRSQ